MQLAESNTRQKTRTVAEPSSRCTAHNRLISKPRTVTSLFFEADAYARWASALANRGRVGTCGSTDARRCVDRSAAFHSRNRSRPVATVR